MSKRVFIWVAHPKPGSLCAGLADAYAAGLQAQGARVKRQDLSDMDFDLNFEGYGPETPDLERDLLIWQDNLAWADHFLVVHPVWWGTMPTKAKAVFDRALTPGFAYKYHGRGIGWDKLLEGKSADAIITSDTPPALDTLLYHRSNRRILRKQVFEFCGVKPKSVVQFGSVKLAKPARIQSWLRQAQTMGARAAA